MFSATQWRFILVSCAELAATQWSFWWSCAVFSATQWSFFIVVQFSPCRKQVLIRQEI